MFFFSVCGKLIHFKLFPMAEKLIRTAAAFLKIILDIGGSTANKILSRLNVLEVIKLL